MRLISFPILLFATAALAVSAFAASAQDGRPLVITAPRYAAPAYARADQRAERRDRRTTRTDTRDFAPDAQPAVEARMPQRGRMGGGFLEFLFSGNPRGYAELPRQPYTNPWHDAAAVQPYDDGRVVLASRGDPAAPAPRVFDPRFAKAVVDYSGDEKPGTVVIDTKSRFLYLVQDDGKAIRYGVGVGRDGFRWNGVEQISQKREWPDWIPPKEMLLRQPQLPAFMPGGIDNPLGARALYLGNTLYRIHGSNEPWTIGRAVSSGCIRMRNEDVIDLYEKVKIGTTVKVI